MKFELASITLVVQKANFFFYRFKKHFVILTIAETESNNIAELKDPGSFTCWIAIACMREKARFGLVVVLINLNNE